MQLKTYKQEQEEKILDELYERLEKSNYTNSLDVILGPYTDAIGDTLKSGDDLINFLHDAFETITVDKIRQYIEGYFKRKDILENIDKEHIEMILSLIKEHKNIFKSDKDVKILEDFVKGKYDVISISHPIMEGMFSSIVFDENLLSNVLDIMQGYFSFWALTKINGIIEEKQNISNLNKLKVVVGNKENVYNL